VIGPAGISRLPVRGSVSVSLEAGQGTVGGVRDGDVPPASVEDGGGLDGDAEFSLAFVDGGDGVLFFHAGVGQRREDTLEGGLLAEDGFVGDEAVGDGDVHGVEFGDQVVALPGEKASASGHVDEAFGLVGREPVAVERQGDDELPLAEAVTPPVAEGRRQVTSPVAEGRRHGGLETHDTQTGDLPTKSCRVRRLRSEPFKYLLRLDRRMQDQGRSTRKRTGGRLRPFRNKKRYQLGRQPAETTVGEPRFQTVDSRGNGTKTRALATNVAHVAVDDETVEADIENVVDNPSNTNYARRNIITKGAILETSEGRARVTSRPGQSGQVNAVLIDE